MDYSALIAFTTFIAGVLLNPVIKKWDYLLNTKQHNERLYIEIEDCCSYLENIIISHFDFLYHLEKNKNENGLINLSNPIVVPLVEKYDTQFIHTFYCEALKMLNPAQRNTIKIIDGSVLMLVEQSESLRRDIQDECYYNTRSIRNIISKSCYVYYHLHRMKIEKERYTGSSSLNSFDSTKHVLLAFGYSMESIEIANPLKTMLSKEQIDTLSKASNQTHSISG
ncbi:hypothetical protein [Aeromonas veronii]|uniref:hypothetical protein n=1 Tax=Aeromonas TaxID=642 RepID=UPI00111A2826|nr:hypothetical protein [Aeromonas veronii]MCR3972413.1 hypothetical protein [Aeromonas veronii]MCR3973743.1 hypothetical protein [Aeromonas veronii]TNJ03224.1 hypothetical protein CF117_12270 [Aeromonas veronii]